MNADSQAAQNVSTVTKIETDDSKETANMKSTWENSFSTTTSGDLNSSDQGM